MYRDNPGWRSFFNLLKSLYKENPVRKDIVGNIESIDRINKDMLYKCYNVFYHPSNMVIFVIGDVDINQIFDQVDSLIISNLENPEIKRIFPKIHLR